MKSRPHPDLWASRQARAELSVTRFGMPDSGLRPETCSFKGSREYRPVYVVRFERALDRCARASVKRSGTSQRWGRERGSSFDFVQGCLCLDFPVRSAIARQLRLVSDFCGRAMSQQIGPTAGSSRTMIAQTSLTRGSSPDRAMLTIAQMSRTTNSKKTPDQITS